MEKIQHLCWICNQTKQFNVMLDYDEKSAISMEVIIWKNICNHFLYTLVMFDVFTISSLIINKFFCESLYPGSLWSTNCEWFV